MEFWTSGFSAPRGIVHVARGAEAQGWDGLSVVDSQNLSGDSFVALTMAATATERLKLGTGVTNSITRNAATLATAIASSALAHLGRAPVRVDQFERYLHQLQAYLSGRRVPFEEIVDIPTELGPTDVGIATGRSAG